MSTSAPSNAPPLPAVQRYFEVSLFLLVSTGVMAVVLTGKLDPVSLALPPIALIYKGVRIWRGHGQEMSARVATWLVLAYFLFFPIDLWFLSRSLSAGAPNPALYAALLAAIHLMLFATLVRLYSARTNRDFAFLAVLAFTCMLSSAILTIETSFLAMLAIFLALAVSTFVALEIRRSATGAVSPPFEPGSPMARQLNRALGLTSALVAVSALLIGGVFFFLIPRFTAGYLSALNLQSRLMTGFGSDITIGEIGKIQQSSAVVMRIHVDGDPGRAQDVHWRGIILTNFDGKRWFTPAHDEVVISPDSDGQYRFDPFGLPHGDFYPLRYTVMMEPVATDAVFVASRPATLRGRFANESERLGVPRNRTYLLIDKTGSLSNPFHNDIKVRYEGVSILPAIPPAQLRKSSTIYPDSITSLYLQVPQLDPRIKQLAEKVVENSHNQYDRAASIELYLKTHYGYTLDLTGRKTDDPLAYFLFERRAGHCEYFAAAMTVMLRDLGIPARYVGGFLPGQYNDVGGDYIVRASDAHAWVEAYFPGYDWVTFDPTPPGNGKPKGVFARLGLYWDWFQFAWDEWVINYDFVHQTNVVQNVQKTSKDWGERVLRYYHDKQRGAINLLMALDRRTEASPYFLPSVLVFLIALLSYLRGRPLIGYLIARWRVRARRGGNLTPSLAALEYREMLRLLEKRGWKKGSSQTPLEFASAILAADLSAPVSQLTELYQSARFGNHAAAVNQMSSLLQSIREMLRSHKQ